MCEWEGSEVRDSGRETSLRKRSKFTHAEAVQISGRHTSPIWPAFGIPLLLNLKPLQSVTMNPIISISQWIIIPLFRQCTAYKSVGIALQCDRINAMIAYVPAYPGTLSDPTRNRDSIHCYDNYSQPSFSLHTIANTLQAKKGFH